LQANPRRNMPPSGYANDQWWLRNIEIWLACPTWPFMATSGCQCLWRRQWCSLANWDCHADWNHPLNAEFS
jgi:hypothetical protein